MAGLSAPDMSPNVRLVVRIVMGLAGVVLASLWPGGFLMWVGLALIGLAVFWLRPPGAPRLGEGRR